MPERSKKRPRDVNPKLTREFEGDQRGSCYFGPALLRQRAFVERPKGRKRPVTSAFVSWR